MKLEARVERLEATEVTPENRVTRIVLHGVGGEGPDAVSEMRPDGTWTPFTIPDGRGVRGRRGQTRKG